MAEFEFRRFLMRYLYLLENIEYLLKTVSTMCMCMSGQADTAEDGELKIIYYCLYAEIEANRDKTPNIGAIRHDYQPGTPPSDPGSFLRRLLLVHNHTTD
jgi:hypothetical protein